MCEILENWPDLFKEVKGKENKKQQEDSSQ